MTTGAGGPGRGRDGRVTADGWWSDEEEGWAPQSAQGWSQADGVEGGEPAEWPEPTWWPWAPEAEKSSAARGEHTPRAGAEQRGEPTGGGRGRHPGQLMLGLAVMAAERLRARPPNDAFLTGIGLLQQGAQGARSLARRAMSPGRITSRALGRAARASGTTASRRSLVQSRQRMGRLVLDARRRGEATVAAGRADASALVQATVADGVAWAQARAVPQIVDGIVPKLVDAVVPKIIDGALPEIRARVLPVVIEDLTHDPALRDLLLEQGSGVIDEAATNLRATAATADDRVESAFGRPVRKPQPDQRTEGGADGGEAHGDDPHWPRSDETSTAETRHE